MSVEKNLKIPFNAPLQARDTVDNAFGCRIKNPNICENGYLKGMCAIILKDEICRRPFRA